MTSLIDVKISPPCAGKRYLFFPQKSINPGENGPYFSGRTIDFTAQKSSFQKDTVM